MIHRFRYRVAASVTGLALAWAAGAAAQTIIIDNNNTNNAAGQTFSALSGDWKTGTSSADKYLEDYRFADTLAGGTAQVEWRPTLPEAGDYEVSVWYPQGTNRAINAPFDIVYAGGSTTVEVNQQTGGGQWVVLGTFTFNAGTDGYVTLTNNASPNVVMADAVRFDKAGVTVTPEWRAMWISRFEWPHANLTTVQNNIRTQMTKLAANNFNAVVFQIRGQGDTLYPSPYEPWSPLLSSNGNTPSGWGSFDPVAFAIAEAHSRGLEFHAYINTHVAWQSAAELPPNYNLNHIWHQHLNAADPDRRDWLIHDVNGPVGFEESGYVWMAPGVPAMQAYVRQQVMHVVETYDVDGIHYDRIRAPGPEYSFDPISQGRRLGTANPHGLGFEDWTRDQINRFVQDLYAQIMEVKPWIKVSSAPLGLYTGGRYAAFGYPQSACGYFYGYSCVYQDAQAWLAAGSQDFICPQIYWADGGGNPDFSEILPDWVAHAAGRHIYAGQITSGGGAALLSQINATRILGGLGNVVFSYGSFNSNNYWASYSGPGGPYNAPAPVPAMPWKDNPTDGIIIGNVTATDGSGPVVDATVTRTGSSWVALSSGDGLYSFLKVPPGSYTLTFNKPGVGTRQILDVQVVAGEVTRVDVQLGELVCDYTNDGIVDLGDLQQLAFCLNGGPENPLPDGHFCLKCDADGDQDLDLMDFAAFQRLFQK